MINRAHPKLFSIKNNNLKAKIGLNFLILGRKLKTRLTSLSPYQAGARKTIFVQLTGSLHIATIVISQHPVYKMLSQLNGVKNNW